MRIVGGSLKGRAIAAPPGRATRPTTDRVREAIFNILSHGIDDFDMTGARVLDLFSGSGALGLEALSRGARFAQFVEESSAARGVIRTNADALGLIGQVKIWRRDATRMGPCAPQPPFDLVFADPPYGKGLAQAALASLVEGGWLAAHAVIVIEEAQGTELAVPANLSVLSKRTYGDTDIFILRAASPDQPSL